MKVGKISSDLQVWIDARHRHRLSHAQVQMARELGMNPRKLGGLDNHHQERWKAPLPDYIEKLYRKRFGKAAPDQVATMEEIALRRGATKAARKAARAAARRGETDAAG